MVEFYVCVSSCVVVFSIVILILIVIEIEKALNYTNFFLRGVTVIVIVTKHPFLLPSIVVVIVIVIVIVIVTMIVIVILILIFL